MSVNKEKLLDIKRIAKDIEYILSVYNITIEKQDKIAKEGNILETITHAEKFLQKSLKNILLINKDKSFSIATMRQIDEDYTKLVITFDISYVFYNGMILALKYETIRNVNNKIGYKIERIIHGLTNIDKEFSVIDSSDLFRLLRDNSISHVIDSRIANHNIGDKVKHYLTESYLNEIVSKLQDIINAYNGISIQRENSELKKLSKEITKNTREIRLNIVRNSNFIIPNQINLEFSNSVYTYFGNERIGEYSLTLLYFG